jgi:hypothetical protein
MPMKKEVFYRYNINQNRTRTLVEARENVLDRPTEHLASGVLSSTDLLVFSIPSSRNRYCGFLLPATSLYTVFFASTLDRLHIDNGGRGFTLHIDVSTPFLITTRKRGVGLLHAPIINRRVSIHSSSGLTGPLYCERILSPSRHCQ